MKSKDIQMQYMLGDQEPHSQDNPSTRREAKVHKDPWGNDMVWYDAMRDLRDKIRVLQMPLFKVNLDGEVKVKIFVSTR